MIWSETPLLSGIGIVACNDLGRGKRLGVVAWGVLGLAKIDGALFRLEGFMMLLSADLFRVGKIGLSEETYVFDQLSESPAAPDRLKETTGASNTARDSIKSI